MTESHVAPFPNAQSYEAWGKLVHREQRKPGNTSGPDAMLPVQHESALDWHHQSAFDRD
jgi:hypothetical protein